MRIFAFTKEEVDALRKSFALASKYVPPSMEGDALITAMVKITEGDSIEDKIIEAINNSCDGLDNLSKARCGDKQLDETITGIIKYLNDLLELEIYADMVPPGV